MPTSNRLRKAFRRFRASYLGIDRHSFHIAQGFAQLHDLFGWSLADDFARLWIYHNVFDFIAVKQEPRRLVAGLVGDPASSGPSVEQSEWLLEEAREDFQRARQTRDALDEQRNETERGLERADRSLRDPVRSVVQTEGTASKVLDQYREAQREVDRLREILSFLSSWDCVPPRWDLRDISVLAREGLPGPYGFRGVCHGPAP